MKSSICFLLVGILCCCCCAAQEKTLPNHVATKTIPKNIFPKPIGYVNDFEKVFSHVEKQMLDSLVRNYVTITGVQIAIVTIDSAMLHGYLFDDYVLQLHNAWGVGSKARNDGIVFCFSKQLRRIRISNGRGIEKQISNLQTKAILNEQVLPQFKQQLYYQGVVNGIQKIKTLLLHGGKS